LPRILLKFIAREANIFFRKVRASLHGPLELSDGTALEVSAARSRVSLSVAVKNKKLSYCWETVRRESMPRIAEMDVTT